MNKMKWFIAVIFAMTVSYAFANLTTVGVTNGVPSSGTGTVSTLDALMADGGQATIGAKADAAYTDGTGAAAGSLTALLKGLMVKLSGALTVNTHAVTQSGSWTVQPGNTANTTPWLVQQSSDYPSTATALTASATGTTAATTATLAGAVGKTTYICSLSIRSNATAAATGNATVTGTVTGTMNYTHWTAPLASGIGVTEQIFSPCIPASATNTAIAVVSPAPGSGGTVSVSATGYQL